MQVVCTNRWSPSLPKPHAPLEWGIEPVKPESRYLVLIDYLALWSSLGVGLLVLLAGVLLVPALSLQDAFLAEMVGNAIGSEYGIPTMGTVSPSFGTRGSYPATINCSNSTLWIVVFTIICIAI